MYVSLASNRSDSGRYLMPERAQVVRIENVFAFHRAKRRILFRQKDRIQKIGYASCIPAQIAGANGGGIARQGQTAFAVLRLHCARGDDLAACPAGAEADCAMVKHPPRQRMFPSSCAILLLRCKTPVLAHRPCLRFHAFSLRTIAPSRPRHSLTAWGFHARQAGVKTRGLTIGIGAHIIHISMIIHIYMQKERQP